MDEKLVEEITDAILRRMDPMRLAELHCLCRTMCLEKCPDRLRLMVECGAERFGLQAGEPHVSSELARYIDHTLLKPEATETQVRALCREAVQFGFASVCINPHWVKLAAALLTCAQPAVCTVIGFPLGATHSDTKAFEARRAVFDGARELDMVLNVGALKSGRDEEVLRDIAGVVQVCHENGAICKVILETALLTDEEKVKACTLCKQAGADFVKTSTGFGPGGATVEDVALMRRIVGPRVGVKASGGIRDLAGTQKMIDAGATRIGASAGVKIIQQQKGMGSDRSEQGKTAAY